MLQVLYLRDFVIVDRAEIEFASGFCALSGETGAGKSILLDALGLALGGRADPAAVRSGAQRTEVTACFKPNEQVSRWLDHHDLANEDETELLLRRVISADGRSKSFINGTPVKLAQLRAIGEQVLEIHGQHASQSLLRADGQRELLDGYAQLQDALARVNTCWRAWQSARKTLAEATGYSAEMAIERERVSWQLDEINSLNMQTGEWAKLTEEQNRLANASSLIAAANGAVQALSEGEQAMHDQLVHIIGQLQSGARLDGKLAGPLEMLESARIQLAEAASDLGAYGDRVDVDPDRLSAIEERVSAIFSLARKLGIEPDELPGRGEQLAARLADLERAQDLEKLQIEVDRLQQDYASEAATVSKIRGQAAKKLAAQVSVQLPELGMPAAQFKIDVRPADPGPHGSDQIEFQFAGHSSLPLRALVKVASGGELSRISLAIAVCAAQANPVPTLIFDEADAGIGGSVADAVGLLMRRLGQARQVMAVTHLPQVAARAHHHFQVSKGGKDSVTSTVTRLSDAQRVDEIARMLGGSKVTATTVQHASELLAMGKAPVADLASAKHDEKTVNKKAKPGRIPTDSTGGKVTKTKQNRRATPSKA